MSLLFLWIRNQPELAGAFPENLAELVAKVRTAIGETSLPTAYCIQRCPNHISKLLLRPMTTNPFVPQTNIRFPLLDDHSALHDRKHCLAYVTVELVPEPHRGMNCPPAGIFLLGRGSFLIKHQGGKSSLSGQFSHNTASSTQGLLHCLPNSSSMLMLVIVLMMVVLVSMPMQSGVDALDVGNFALKQPAFIGQNGIQCALDDLFLGFRVLGGISSVHG